MFIHYFRLVEFDTSSIIVHKLDGDEFWATQDGREAAADDSVRFCGTDSVEDLLATIDIVPDDSTAFKDAIRALLLIPNGDLALAKLLEAAVDFGYKEEHH